MVHARDSLCSLWQLLHHSHAEKCPAGSKTVSLAKTAEHAKAFHIGGALWLQADLAGSILSALRQSPPPRPPKKAQRAARQDSSAGHPVNPVDPVKKQDLDRIYRIDRMGKRGFPLRSLRLERSGREFFLTESRSHGERCALEKAFSYRWLPSPTPPRRTYGRRGEGVLLCVLERSGLVTQGLC